MTKISHSKLNTYEECGMKYFYKYVEYLYEDSIPSALMFGIAIDETLNYVLECKRDGKEHSIETVRTTFHDHMTNWNGVNPYESPEFECTQNDIDYYLLTEDQITDFELVDPDFRDYITASQDKQKKYTKWFKENFPIQFKRLGWFSLYNKGLLMLDTYINEILPQFKRILDVQIKYHVPNGEGDQLTLIMDFVAELHDGRVVVFDNKTTANAYPDDSVRTSPQLATYLEFWDTEWAGYIALEKKIRKDKRLRYQFIVDQIPEEFTEETFDKFSNALYNIKNELFERNEESCFKWRRRCEYESICKHNEIGKLKKRNWKRKK